MDEGTLSVVIVVVVMEGASEEVVVEVEDEEDEDDRMNNGVSSSSQSVGSSLLGSGVVSVTPGCRSYPPSMGSDMKSNSASGVRGSLHSSSVLHAHTVRSWFTSLLHSFLF